MIHPHRYFESDVFRQEIISIFMSRLYVGESREYADENMFNSFLLGGKTAITCRRMNGIIQAFDNVCLHRKCLIDPLGQGRRGFRCGYHGWRYDEKGMLINAPGFDMENIQCRELKKYKVDESGGLIFLGGDIKPDLSEVAPLLDSLGLVFSEQAFYQGRTQHSCNWKIMVENALDREHLSQVHSKTFGPQGIDSSTPVDYGKEKYSLWSKITPKESSAGRAMARFDGVSHGYSHGYVFPNLFVANTNNMIAYIGQLIPVSPSETLLNWQLYELPSLLNLPVSVRNEIKREAVDFAEKVINEDKEIVELCQLGVSSGGGCEFQLQPSEKQVKAFHDIYCKYFSQIKKGK